MTQSPYSNWLPAYLAKQLSAEEVTQLETALASDEELKQELAMWRGIQNELRAAEPDYSPGELGLKRLQREIAQNKQASAPLAANDNQRFWRPAAIAACLLVLLQLGIEWSQPSPDTLYQAAQGDHMSGTSGEMMLHVTFAPTATEEQIRRLLREQKLQFKGGPSALGVYQLSSHVVARDLQQLLTTLHDTEFVESVQVHD